MTLPQKYLFALLITVSVAFVSKAQEPTPRKTNIGSLVNNQTVNEKTGILYRDWAARAREAGASLDAGEGVKGSFFINDGWSKGFLVFDGEKKVMNITLAFNAATNEIYILKDSQVLVLDGSLPVTDFGFYDQDDSLRIKAVFRCGYPGSGLQTSKTFYQVLADGKLSLLKFTGKKLIQVNNAAGVPTRNIATLESWYVHDSTDNSIKKIRLTKNAAAESFPQRVKAIESVLEEKKLKLKTEPDWVLLINALNNKP